MDLTGRGGGFAMVGISLLVATTTPTSAFEGQEQLVAVVLEECEGS